jgi:YD repeat-containing protein
VIGRCELVHKSCLHAWFLIAAIWAAAAFAETVNYTYDDAGRLIRVAYANGKTIHYTYDKAGNLLSRLVSTGAAPAVTGARRPSGNCDIYHGDDSG